jgi:prepilin-type N-terminal cleavage/methylation domain-containing protein
MRRVRGRLRAQRGMTLVEVMVAMSMALIVSAAVLAIVIVSVHLSSNYADRVDANQLGRLAMEKITQELNSSCVRPNQAPIIAGSSDTQISFYNATNDKPGPIPNQITVSMPSRAQQPGQLVLFTQYLSGTPPNWTPTGQTDSRVLADWAAQSTLPGSSTPIPVFQYYAYGQNGVINPTPISPGPQGLTASQAASVTMVRINYQILPTDGRSDTHRPVDFTGSVTFRVSPPNSQTNATNLPCL